MSRFGYVSVAALLVAWAASPAAGQEPVKGPATLVILPPQVKTTDAKSVQVAELVCDRLAERIGRLPGVKVVNRKEIELVLAERQLAKRPVGPALSYDVMVRLVVDLKGSTPQVQLSVVGLTMGNLAATKSYPWKEALSAKGQAAMADVCASSARSVVAAPAPKLKVRIVGTTVVDRAVRLAPLGGRLERTFEQLLTRSAGVQMVHHLEAASAKEESLLILMGLTRLPGGRRFAPQADVTVEFRLKELSAIGKTFEDTTVEAAVRLGGAVPGQWTTFTGKVRNWDAMAKQLWDAAAGKITGVDAKAGQDFLNEMAVRRRQAQAEIAKHDDWDRPSGVKLQARYRTERLKELAAAAATAAKLDPTWDRAAYLSVTFDHMLGKRLAREQRRPSRDVYAITFQDALRYLARSNTEPLHRTKIVSLASLAGHYGMSGGDSKALETYRKFLDSALAEPATSHQYWGLHGNVAGHYWRLSSKGKLEEASVRWFEQALARMDARLLEGREAGYVVTRRRPFENTISLNRFHDLRAWIRVHAMRLAIDLGQTDKARALVDELMRIVPNPKRAYQTCSDGRDQIKRLKDPQLLAKFEKWLGRQDRRKNISPLQITRTVADISAELKRAPTIKAKLYPVKGKRHVAVLGKIGRNLYAVRSHSPETIQFRWSPSAAMVDRGSRTVCAIPLDGRDRPSGTIVNIPLPKTRRNLLVHDGCVLAGRVYMGTHESGLLAYDPKTKKWTVYGDAQGLPGWTVYRVRPIDEQTLLCTGGVDYEKAVVYTFNVKTKEVTLHHREVKPKGLGRLWEMRDAWRHNGRVMAMCRHGLATDVLTGKMTFQRWPESTPAGRKVLAQLMGASRLAVVAGRRFVSGGGGLREISPTGKTLRVWGYNTFADPSTPFYAAPGYQRIYEPGMLPGLTPAAGAMGSGTARAWLIGSDDKRLFMRVGPPGGLICYDVETDTWYGPVKLAGKYGDPTDIHAADGIWLQEKEGLRLILGTTIVAAARKAGLVRTSDELRAQRLALLDASPPLDAAKFAMGLNRLDKAKEILTKLLEKEPDNAEGLLLMGRLHDWSYRREPQIALTYYRRLAQQEDPRAVLAGLYYQYGLHIYLKNWDEALPLGKRIVAEFALWKHDKDRIVRQNKKIAKLAGKPKS